MKTVKRILMVIAVILLLITAVGLMFFKSEIHVERSIVVNRTQADAFEFMNGFHHFNSWSPWMEKDPGMVVSYEGPTAGVGAKMSWNSKVKDVGKGSMTISETSGDSLVKENLEFDGHGNAIASYHFAPEGNGTKITWAMDMNAGANPLMRIMGSFMDKMVGPDFEKGLAKLKTVIEVQAGNSLKVEESTNADIHYLAFRDTASVSTIGMKLGKGFGMVGAAAAIQKLKMAGAPMAIYYSNSSEKFDFDVAMPSDKAGKDDGPVKAGTIKAGKVVMVRFFGAYEKTGEAYAALKEYIKLNNKQIIGSPWESYITDPMIVKDTAKWETDVYFPVQ